MDCYNTISSECIAEIKIKGSRFIGTALPINSREQVVERLDMLHSKYYDATHNCYGYRLGCGDTDIRSSDDGEPSGTAGKPILLSIKKYDLSDLLVVVTRYFGGTKLGVGGLIRAYSETSELVLQQCETKVVNLTEKVKIECRYEEISLIKRLLSQTAISYTEEYTDKVLIIAEIPLSQVDAFIEQVINMSNTLASANRL